MFRFRSIALLGLIVVAPIHGARRTTGPLSIGTAQTRVTGAGYGSWQLQEFGSPVGTVLGTIFVNGTHPRTFNFTGSLAAVASSPPPVCLACIGGELVGTLDDGIGPGPDYYVLGSYTGAWLTGQGRFEAVLRTAPFPVGPIEGVIEGGFHDAPSDGLPGGFRCILNL